MDFDFLLNEVYREPPNGGEYPSEGKIKRRPKAEEKMVGIGIEPM